MHSRGIFCGNGLHFHIILEAKESNVLADFDSLSFLVRMRGPRRCWRLKFLSHVRGTSWMKKAEELKYSGTSEEEDHRGDNRVRGCP